MRTLLRVILGSVALAAAAACSPSSQPAMTDDLKSDLAKVGGTDVQLAGTSSPRLDVVSASERAVGNAPAPHAPAVARAPSAAHGSRAVVKSVHHAAPVAVASRRAQDVAPAAVPDVEVAPQPVPSQRRPEQAPSNQPEPRGGWKSEGQVFRNAPFPINPLG